MSAAAGGERVDQVRQETSERDGRIARHRAGRASETVRLDAFRLRAYRLQECGCSGAIGAGRLDLTREHKVGKHLVPPRRRTLVDGHHHRHPATRNPLGPIPLLDGGVERRDEDVVDGGVAARCDVRRDVRRDEIEVGDTEAGSARRPG